MNEVQEEKVEKFTDKREHLNLELNRIFQNRLKFTRTEVTEGLPQYNTSDNTVWLNDNEQALYASLLKEALVMTGFSLQEAKDRAEELLAHEFAHRQEVGQGKETLWGVAFIEVIENDGSTSLNIQPVLTVRGRLTGEEKHRIASAPSQPSTDDLRMTK